MVIDREGLFLKGLGVFFLAWGILAVFHSFYLLKPYQVFWNCYVGLLLIGIGILMKSGKLVGSQIVILGIPLLIWDVDFIYHLVTGLPLLGITDYFFFDNFVTLSKVISMQHLFTLPLGLYVMHKLRVKKFDFWKVSVVQIILLYIVIFLFTPASQNVGCVFSNCVSLELSLLSGIPYEFLWFVAFFAVIFISNWLIYLWDRKTGWFSGKSA